VGNIMKLTDRADYDVGRMCQTLFKAKSVRDKKRLSFARTLPCAGCGKLGPNESHHEGPHGMGIKAGDDKTIPLCRKCHAWRHQTGPSVYLLWHVDIEALICKINATYKAKLKGLQ